MPIYSAITDLRTDITGMPTLISYSALPTTVGRLDPYPVQYKPLYDWSAYAQDDFKLTSKLTLSYESATNLTPPSPARDGNLYSFDLASGSIINPRRSAKTLQPLLPSLSPCKDGEPGRLRKQPPQRRQEQLRAPLRLLLRARQRRQKPSSAAAGESTTATSPVTSPDTSPPVLLRQLRPIRIPPPRPPSPSRTPSSRPPPPEASPSTESPRTITAMNIMRVFAERRARARPHYGLRDQLPRL